MSINRFGLDRAAAIELTSVKRLYLALDPLTCTLLDGQSEKGLAEYVGREFQQSTKATDDYCTRYLQPATVHLLKLAVVGRPDR